MKRTAAPPPILVLAALASAGCAQLLGLDNTQFHAMDAPIDAPSLCDPTPPTCVATTGRSVCGQIKDTGAGAGASLRAPDPTGEVCAAPTADGPCALTVAALPLADYFAGTTASRVNGTVDNCGRFVVLDLPPAAADIAIVIEGTGYRRTAALLLKRPTGVGIDEQIQTVAVTVATLNAWAEQLGGSPDLSSGYLIRYRSVTDEPRVGELVAMDGLSPSMNKIGTVPWAAYFAGNAPFASLDPMATDTQQSGTALAVFGAGTFSVDGYRTGKRCRVLGLQQVANTLIDVIVPGC